MGVGWGGVELGVAVARVADSSRAPYPPPLSLPRRDHAPHWQKMACRPVAFTAASSMAM